MAWQRFYLDQRGWIFLILVGAVIVFSWIAGQDPDGKDGQACSLKRVETGDTIQATCAGQAVTIRLRCIDAPDLAQGEWGRESRDYLRRIAPPIVSLRAHGQDRSGRLPAGDLGDGQRAVATCFCRAQWARGRMAENPLDYVCRLLVILFLSGIVR